jgi:streptogramin lyase
VNAVEGQIYSGDVAAFSDANIYAPADDFTATIDWGDGDITTGRVEPVGFGVFTVNGDKAYHEEGSYQIKVSIADDGGSIASATSTVQVADAALTPLPSAIKLVEGSGFSGIAGSFLDGNPSAEVTDFRAMISWGDGGISTGQIIRESNGQFDVSGAHNYDTREENSTYSIKIDVTDIGGSSTSIVGTATVQDAPLSARGMPVQAAEGVEWSGAVATFDDADPGGALGDYTAQIDWGDGKNSIGVITQSGSGFAVLGDHMYGEGGAYVTTISVTDLGGSAVTAQGTATVSDPPITALPAVFHAVEGAPSSGIVATLTDADLSATANEYTIQIAWGDGTSSTGSAVAGPNGFFEIVGSHSYGEEGSKPITVQVRDAGGSQSTVTSAALAVDASLSATGMSISPPEGGTFTGTVATLTDANPAGAAADYSATIDWGDGQFSAATFAADPRGGFDIMGSHRYGNAEEGTSFTVRVAIKDTGGSTTSASTTAVVADAPLSATGTSVSSPEGGTFTGIVATFSDADPSGAVSDYSATITWGDGQSSAGTIAVDPRGGFDVMGNHGYGNVEEGTSFHVAVTIADAGGSTSQISSTATVTDAPLSAAGTTGSAQESAVSGAGVEGEFPIPTPKSTPDAIAASADGNVWFNEQFGNKVGYVSPAGVVHEFALPTPNSQPSGIAVDGNGVAWFAEDGSDKIGRITPSGALAEFSLPTPSSSPIDITLGPDGNFWFAEPQNNKIGRITPAGAVSEFPIPTANSRPVEIRAGSDGALWFTEYNGNRIGRITITGVVREFVIPTAGSKPYGIAAGPDGNIWFTESVANKVGRITPAGKITEFATASNDYHFDITAGPDGNLWYTECNSNTIVQLSVTGVVLARFQAPTTGSVPSGITAGSDGGLWFTEQSAGKIGRLQPPQKPSADFSTPTAKSEPLSIAAGPDGNLWFTESAANKIGRITPAGVVTEFSIPTANSGVNGITAGPGGNLWFVEGAGNKVGQVTPTGAVKEFPIPTPSSNPQYIAAGPGGNLWFTEWPTGKIGRVTPAGVVTEFRTPSASSEPAFIVAGPDGNLWFTEQGANKIGRITPAGVITEYAIPTANSGVDGITAGPDGNLWFTEYKANKIGRITPAGIVTEYPIPITGSAPYVITTGPDGALWFTGFGANLIGRITTSGTFSEFSVPTAAASQPYGGIAAGPDGSIWFTEYAKGKVGEIPLTVIGVPFGGVVATFTDADPAGAVSEYTATIEWGDGQLTSGAIGVDPAGGFTVSGSHSYFEGGTHAVKVRIADEGGSTTTAAASIHIADFPLTQAVGGTFDVMAGATLQGPVASFLDTDPGFEGVGVYSATISWGDGTSSPGGVEVVGVGRYDVAGRHVYASVGTYPITVVIHDDGGASITASGTANVLGLVHADVSLPARAAAMKSIERVSTTTTIGQDLIAGVPTGLGETSRVGPLGRSTTSPAPIAADDAATASGSVFDYGSLYDLAIDDLFGRARRRRLSSCRAVGFTA